MNFMFIDESERQRRKNKYFFALCGAIVSGEDIFTLEEKIRKLKEIYNLDNLKDLKSSKNLEKQEKLKISKEILGLLKENKVIILSTILGKVALCSINNIEERYFDALSFMIERFFLRLNKENKRGILIHDSVEKKLEKKLRKKLHKFVMSEELLMMGKSRGKFKTRIYPSILFSDDDHSEILQVTDLIATSLNGAAWKCLEETSTLATEKLPEYNDYLKIYWSLFDKSPGGKVDGWGVKIWW